MMIIRGAKAPVVASRAYDDGFATDSLGEVPRSCLRLTSQLTVRPRYALSVLRCTSASPVHSDYASTSPQPSRPMAEPRRLADDRSASRGMHERERVFPLMGQRASADG
jgi:hypothetical protein